MEIRRLGAADAQLARDTFAMMGEVFDEEPWEVLGDEHLDRLLRAQAVWAYAAIENGAPVGGLTAHVLPMTREATSELLIYDLAVRADVQRRGIGRARANGRVAGTPLTR